MGDVILLKPIEASGRKFSVKQILQIQETVHTFKKLSRNELASTICEHLNWFSPKGTPKLSSCLHALERFEKLGLLSLPQKQVHKKSLPKSYKSIVEMFKHEPLQCSLLDIEPLELCGVTSKSLRELWNGYVDSYHYLGYKRPFGPHLRYFIVSKKLDNQFLGCLLFAPSAWALESRDTWIGWSKSDKKKRLNLIINNSRFLIFPWIKVDCLASKVLSMVSHTVADDWHNAYGYLPVLLETFVDPIHYEGTCYKAANWQYIGNTTGRGRTGFGRKINTTVKKIFVFPLTPNFRATLRNERTLPVERHKKEVKFTEFWQKIVDIIANLANIYDQSWQKRSRIIDTMMLILLIFRLLLSKNSQSYHTTLFEFWDHCQKDKLGLPQKKPIAPSSFTEARSKLDEGIFKSLNKEIIYAYEQHSQGNNWLNHRIFAVDGSKINLPRSMLKNGFDTPANSHYPQGLVSALYQLKSKIPYDFDLVKHADERKCAQSHLIHLKAEDIVVYDRGYFSYQMLYEHLKNGIYAIFRLQEQSFKIIQEFMQSDATDKIVTIEPINNTKRDVQRKFPEINIIPLKLRLIRYSRKETTYFLGTTLLSDSYRIDDFSDVYHARWGIEELYKISKVLINVEDFHGRSERGVRQELFAHFVLITISRLFSNHGEDELNNLTKPEVDSHLVQKQKSFSVPAFRVNFKNCLATISRNLEILVLGRFARLKSFFAEILKAATSAVQKSRPNRSYSRKSMKPGSRWKPSHSKNIEDSEQIVQPPILAVGQS